LGQKQDVVDTEAASALHILQDVCSAALENVPLEHAVHTLAPICEVNVPLPQFKQAA